MNQLEDFLTPTQNELFDALYRVFSGKTVRKKSRYILVRGEAPIMLIAHLDTVHKERVKHICRTQDGNILMSPQGIGGDDRCGVYALVTVYKQSGIKPWLLFTCDEEIGGVGAGVFCQQFRKGKLPEGLKDLKCLVEIDRKGKNDAVYYECANDDFEAYITSKGFKTEWGSYSDISDIAPELGIAAVNLSAGYYNAHTQHEYINRSQLNATIKKVMEIVSDSVKPDFPRYEYIEAVREKYNLHYGDLYDYGGLYDYGCEDIPADIEELYSELLDYYTPEELDAGMDEYGDSYIRLLYEAEFGICCKSLDEDEWIEQNK